MATLLEIGTIASQSGFSDFKEKCKGATINKAAAIIDTATPNAGLLAWALEAIQTPQQSANLLIPYVIGTNSNATVAAILGANDTQISNNISAAVDALYTSSP